MMADEMNATTNNAAEAATVTIAPAPRAWTCPNCVGRASIPAEIPADATIECSICGFRDDPARPKRTKVAIVGFADSWPLTPWHNADWDVWCLNQFYDLAPKVDYAGLTKARRLRWFEQHRRHDLENDPNVIGRHPQHLAKLREMKCPVYMQERNADIPTSVRYPLERVVGHFGRYFTNSISYMIALALLEGFREIGLYGVNMALESEYAFQRPSCEYFLGWARGAGIVLHLPPQSDLLKAPYLYGYEDDKTDAMIAKIDQLVKEHSERMLAEQREQEQHGANAQQYHGALQQLQVMKRYYTLGR